MQLLLTRVSRDLGMNEWSRYLSNQINGYSRPMETPDTKAKHNEVVRGVAHVVSGFWFWMYDDPGCRWYLCWVWADYGMHKYPIHRLPSTTAASG